MYSIGVRLYAGALKIAQHFHPKAKAWVEGRKNWTDKLPEVTDRDVYWFHCASLGEFDQGIPVMNYIREHIPNAYILTTFFSPSGMEHYHKRKHPSDFVCYIPVDTKKNARKFAEHFKPKATFFVKYEFWENHINAVKAKGSKTYSISTLLRPKQHFFHPILGKFTRNVLYAFDYFFVQNEETKRLLNGIGIQQVMQTGDTRFDRVLENKKQLIPNETVIDFVGDSTFTLIAGSVWKPDLEALKETILTRKFEKVIIAPHQIDEEMIAHIEQLFPNQTTRFTEYKGNANPILILDTIGHLASAYSYGNLAYVGGGFSGSLHNILEPAVFGLPVIFGPKHSKFPEASYFIQEGIGFSIANTQELGLIVDELSPEKVNQLKLKTAKLVEENAGAAEKIGSFVISNLTL